MGVATLRISCESLVDVAAMLKHMGVNIVGSREGDWRSVCLVVEGECVPDANMVMATIHTERTKEANSLKLTFEVDTFVQWETSRAEVDALYGHS